VCDLIGLVLQSLQRFDVGRTPIGRRLKKLAQMLHRFFVTIGHFRKQIEELFFARQETHAILGR